MNLVDYLPARLQGTEISGFLAAVQPQMTDLGNAIDDFKIQLSPTTATWGLEYWEKALGLTVDVSKSYAYRRTRVIAKLRGAGTTTVAMIQNVAESFSNGEVEVLEYPAEYRFEILFVGTLGTPPNMDDLTAAIEEIKPAHLGYGYVYTYHTWGVVAAHTWGELESLTWDDVLEGDL